MPALQSSIAPLLNIGTDLLKVPQLAADVSALQGCSATCNALQPLVGIKDQLLQVGHSARWWVGGQTGQRVAGRAPAAWCERCDARSQQSGVIVFAVAACKLRNVAWTERQTRHPMWRALLNTTTMLLMATGVVCMVGPGPAGSGSAE